jgi:hypothetical protein
MALTLDTRRRGVLERVERNRNGRRALWCVGNRACLRGALAHVRPFVGGGGREAIGDGTIRAVDHTCTAGMNDAGNSFFFLLIF